MRLTTQDASFIYAETASGPMNATSIAVIEGRVPFEKIVRQVEARLHLVPRYRQRLAFVPFNLAHPSWVDDDHFDVAKHIVRKTLPEGSTLNEAIEDVMELNQQLLDRSRPLWKMVVVEGVPNRTLLVHMAHHAMVDGVSGIDISMVLMDLDPDAPGPPPPDQPWKPAPAPSAADLLGEALRDNFEKARATNLLGAAREMGREHLLVRATQSLGKFITQPAITAPWNASTVGPQRKFAWSKHALAEFREIRRALGGTLNDVVLTVVTEAAARYLADHKEPSKDKYFRLMCPVSVRREDEHGALGNRVSAMFPRLPAWPMDTAQRLTVVSTETGRIKADQEPQALQLMTETAPDVPPVALAASQLVGTPFDPTALAARFPMPVPPRWFDRLPNFGFNFTCTNIPGVQVPQYLAGHKVLHMLGVLMLVGNLGFGIALLSYNQMLYFNLVSDPRLLPDLDAMLENVEAAFHELLREARRRNPAAPEASAAGS